MTFTKTKVRATPALCPSDVGLWSVPQVTDEDLILLENHVEAACGDRLRLEKVLLVGARNFTLVGRPLLAKELVRVEATVLEKTQSWPKVHMRFWKRHRFQRKKIIVQPQTVLRINSVRLVPALT